MTDIVVMSAVNRKILRTEVKFQANSGAMSTNPRQLTVDTVLKWILKNMKVQYETY